ncbi:hypothetical protein [Streptomyces colonosanans]|uniref:Uncharacterized protein n=1 Tax=Streptomyces colonosanans TaxID=1428652 RepID=A0A1S2PPF5_9ACTN|nr:hypothetical protein [Streptomyces colonosanans]OIJ95416.1 hypothetical protein BIV24_09040 [Streptomyces colonosanans]
MVSTTEATRPRPPLHCHWVQEPDGTRWLVPGCMSRLHDADADACTCPTLAQQLEDAQGERDQAQRAYSGLRAWTDAIIAAVNDHPDGKKIMKGAADRASCC